MTKSKIDLERDHEPRCVVCGCSDEDGCPGGCSWADPEGDLNDRGSACVGLAVPGYDYKWRCNGALGERHGQACRVLRVPGGVGGRFVEPDTWIVVEFAVDQARYWAHRAMFRRVGVAAEGAA